MAGVGPQPGILGTVNEQHGILWAAARRGKLFRGGNQAAVATAQTAGLPTTYTGGLILYNPLTSGCYLSIREVAFSYIVAQTAASVIGLGVAQSASALTGTLTVVPNANALVGSATVSKGVLYSSASITLPVAPVLVANLGVQFTGAITTIPLDGPNIVQIGGGIELAPGGYMVFTSSAAGIANSFFGSCTWEEITPGP
jgi:hypothetical protein